MSSGKASINYSIETFDNSTSINLSNLPVFEKKDLIHLKQQEIVKKLNKFYGKIIDVHFLLLNNDKLTNNQKLEYCTIERYFMKLYLREMMKKKQ